MKLPARGAPEREIMEDGDGRRERQVRRACFSYRVATLSVLSRPLPCHTTCGGGGGRGAVAHRLCSEVSSPSCEGTLPLRSVSVIHLCKRGAGAGSWGERRQTQRVASATRVLPLRAATLRAIPPPTLPRLGGGGGGGVRWLTGTPAW